MNPIWNTCPRCGKQVEQAAEVLHARYCTKAPQRPSYDTLRGTSKPAHPQSPAEPKRPLNRIWNTWSTCDLCHQQVEVTAQAVHVRHCAGHTGVVLPPTEKAILVAQEAAVTRQTAKRNRKTYFTGVALGWLGVGLRNYLRGTNVRADRITADNHARYAAEREDKIQMAIRNGDQMTAMTLRSQM